MELAISEMKNTEAGKLGKGFSACKACQAKFDRSTNLYDNRHMEAFLNQCLTCKGKVYR